MTEIKKLQHLLVGRQIFYINLERAAMVLTLRTTVLSDETT